MISQLLLPGDETQKFVAQLRPWAEADDGKPTYMVNLNRCFPKLHRWPGTPVLDDTPKESHALYQKRLTSKWLRNASYPMLSGVVQGQNVMKTQPELQNWSYASFVRIGFVRK